MALHSKHHNEKRNQELLLKRFTPDTPNSSAKSALTSARRADKSLMSKSLTLDLEKGQYGQDNATKSRTRKKSELEKSLKSVQRQTPSRSSMRMSSSMSEKEQSGDNKLSRIRDQAQNGTGSGKTANKKRDSVTGKTLSTTEKKSIASAGENIKRADVFERLSRPDCNKGVTRSEHGPGNRIRDRSPAKTGRKSPQEKNVAADKHQKDRRPATGDAPAKSAQNRKRDSSPIKKGDNRRKVISPQGTLRGRKITHERLPHTEEDKDGSREKLEKDNVPESPDKDLEETLVGDDADKKLAVAFPGEVQGRDIPPEPNHGAPLVGDSNGIRGRKGRLETAANGKLGHSVMPSPSLEGAAVTDSSFTSKQVSQNAHSFQSTSLPTSCKDKDKVLNGATKELPRSPESLPKITRRESNPRGIDSSPVELSKADVMMKVRQRVPCEIRRDTKDVVDDDKDVCETEKCEDDDFYKIKVQTRLVSYSNSTLIIRNTSKSDSAGDLSGGGGCGGDGDVTGGGSEGGEGGEGQAKECETFHPQQHPTPQNHTLQTSSVPPASAPQSTEVDTDSKVLDLACHEMKEGERNGEEDTAPLTRSRSMRLRLSQFVSKGKNFLTDVYSATQSKLEQYTRVDPSNIRSASRNNIMTTSSPAVILTDKVPLHASLPNDSDSGYYSISTSLEAMQSVSSGGPPRSAFSRGNTCDVASRIDQGNPNSSLAGGLVDTPDRSIVKNDGGKESVTKGNVGEEVEDEEEEAALPTPPEPHVNFTLNEDWIKKNILCTCKCNKNKVKTAAESCSASQEVVAANTSDSSCSSDGAETVILDEKYCTANNETECVNVERNEESESSDANEAVDAATKDLDDDLCLCSCHEGEENQQLHQLPQEVQELLDADHARMWWTITGNFGNILPIDWSKTYTRQQYLPVLNLNEAKSMTSPADESERTAEDDAEEEEVAQDLDLHHLIINGLSAEPVKSAEEVIKEIDDLMQEGSSSEDEGVEEASSDGVNANEPLTQPLPPPLYAEKLNNMSIGELNEAYMELELVIRQYSETLINQLALRDELEYEKELKNSFISLLLQVQNKRRNFNVEKKKQKKVGPNGIDPKYLTTVIPYDVGHGPPQNETLQILIKILMAINEDSPTVPTLLTDYILKVLCPS
ncbi:LOW QUALITY PROTEIN: dentin sialophosphoprotein [Macrobrachium rosenbergii]|uniref:LOW QUALITY PROTEIN: dentin sialophosphoprotein n=1 Tax=Macrobrachium rosenbergii TaxID=79674 RepID=UPI0034D7ADCE